VVVDGGATAVSGGVGGGEGGGDQKVVMLSEVLWQRLETLVIISFSVLAVAQIGHDRSILGVTS
jgi:hypothetical protein